VQYLIFPAIISMMGCFVAAQHVHRGARVWISAGLVLFVGCFALLIADTGLPSLQKFKQAAMTIYNQ
jgi:hypothetical protein